MAYQLLRVGKSRNWHYRFQVAGRRIQRSTRERNKDRADAVARQAYDAAVVTANGGKPVPTLRELFSDWLDVHRMTASAHHLRSVEICYRLHLYGLGDKRVCDISTEDIETARNRHLLERTPSTANHWLRIIKLVGNWAVRRKEITAVPWKVKMLKVQKRPRATLPTDIAGVWFKALDAAARRPAVSTAVRLMFGLGLRESEAASARWEWIDWQRVTYTPGETKGREAEPVPIPDWLAAHLQAMRKAEGLIAPKDGEQRLPAGFARIAMQRANRACSIKGITPHRLRGTFATLLLEAGVPPQMVKEMLRHKHILTTMGYAERNFETAIRGQQKISQIIGFNRRESGEGHESNTTEN